MAKDLEIKCVNEKRNDMKAGKEGVGTRWNFSCYFQDLYQLE